VYVGRDNLASLVGSQIYLPEEWLNDPRAAAGGSHSR